MVPSSIPKSLAVIGSGAIGSELAYFYKSMGSQVYLIEFLDRIVPLEDDDVSAQLARSFRKEGIKVMVSSAVTSISILPPNECADSVESVEVTLESKKGEEKIMVERVLCAVGVEPNTQNLALDEIGIKTTRRIYLLYHFLKLSQYYCGLYILTN